LNKEVSGSFGVAGVKAAMDLCGFCGGFPRKPLLPLNAQQLATLKNAVGNSKLSRQGGDRR